MANTTTTTKATSVRKAQKALAKVTAAQQAQPATPVATPATVPTTPAVIVAKPSAARLAALADPAGAAKPTSYAMVANGTWRGKDVPACAKRTATLQALLALGATSPGAAVNAPAVCAKAGAAAQLAPRDVRHYAYHAQCAGLTGVVASVPGGRGYGFYLTPAGVASLQGAAPALGLAGKQGQ